MTGFTPCKISNFPLIFLHKKFTQRQRI